VSARPRVALVHDWLTGMRGGERCLEVFAELLPDADLYALVHLPGRVSPVIERRRIVTSFIQRLPGASAHFRAYLPLFPAAIERFDLSGYDLVLSSSHCVAKAARPGPGASHVCYCFTPMRYVWDLYSEYVRGRAAQVVVHPLAAWFRRWDRRTASRVGRFVAISQFVADRIRRCYGRGADVIYPPVDTARFRVADDPGEFYLVVSALVPYKRVDLAVEAARRLGRRLIVVGSGPEERRLRARTAPGIEFLGHRSDAEIAELYARCRALLFPGVEDFGIVPLEALAAGRPVIALGRGGVRETVHPLGGDGVPTGVFFEEPTVDALAAAIERFEANENVFEPKALRRAAEAFDRAVFKDRVAGYLAQVGAC
jgi:glycosyltransferase involved in cell wall biosynthesis